MRADEHKRLLGTRGEAREEEEEGGWEDEAAAAADEEWDQLEAEEEATLLELMAEQQQALHVRLSPPRPRARRRSRAPHFTRRRP